MRFQLSRNFLSNAPFIHCLHFIYARKNYATVELGLPVPGAQIYLSRKVNWYSRTSPSTQRMGYS